MKFRLLNANEIEVRVGSINEKGATLLLYKDARCDMNLLEESGVKWKREHEVINGKLFCTVSIYDTEIKEWVSRQDVGVESNTEATKGEASDSFKRASVEKIKYDEATREITGLSVVNDTTKQRVFIYTKENK
jgi:hypothetical protein